MRLLDFARLVRLPNVFTVWADIFLAALATQALPDNLSRFVLVLLASTCFYWSGMIWNDYFDIEQDKRERPFRPLASGRVSVKTGVWLAVLLMVFGYAILMDDSGVYHTSIPILLCACILLYDGWLKRTWAGPIAMGACRFFNILLGLSMAPVGTGMWGITLGLAVGVYIAGVTWFARTEAQVSNQNRLIVGAALIYAGLILGLTVPPLAQEAGAPIETSFLFPYLMAAFGFYVGIALIRAIRRPLPERVQAAVKRAILGLIVLDAILATALAGLIGLAILALLIPAYVLGRWVYST